MQSDDYIVGINLVSDMLIPRSVLYLLCLTQYPFGDAVYRINYVDPLFSGAVGFAQQQKIDPVLIRFIAIFTVSANIIISFTFLLCFQCCQQSLMELKFANTE